MELANGGRACLWSGTGQKKAGAPEKRRGPSGPGLQAYFFGA